MRGTRTEQPRICVGTGASLPALVLLACVALAAQCSGQEPTYSTWDRFFYKVELPVKAAAPTLTTEKTRCELKDLKSGQTWFVRVVPVNSAGQRFAPALEDSGYVREIHKR